MNEGLIIDIARKVVGTDIYYQKLNALKEDVEFFTLYMKRNKKSDFDFNIRISYSCSFRAFNDIWMLPKRILDGIIEMIYALDKIAPGTANDDTLLYGVEVKFYNMEVQLDEHLESIHKGLYIIGDGSGVTHSLSHASASGVYVAREILESMRK